MIKQISFVIDGVKYFTAFGASGMLETAMDGANVVTQKDIIGSNALTRSLEKLAGMRQIDIPVMQVTEYSKDGKNFTVKGLIGGEEYLVNETGITCLSDEAVVEQETPIVEEPVVQEYTNSVVNEAVSEDSNQDVESELQEVLQMAEELVKQEEQSKAPMSQEERRDALRELMRGSKAGMLFGKRKAETKAMNLQIGDEGEPGFLYQANVVQPSRARRYGDAPTRRLSVTGRPIRTFPNEESTFYNRSQNTGNAHERRKIDNAKIQPQVVTEAKCEVIDNKDVVPKQPVKPVFTKPAEAPKPIPKNDGVPSAWKLPVKPEPIKPVVSTENTTDNERYLNDLFNNSLQESSSPPIVAESVQPEPLTEKPVKHERSKLIIDHVSEEEREESLKELLLEQPAEVEDVLLKAPIILFGDEVKQFTTKPVDVEQLEADGVVYCIDGRWFKCGDWFAIDVVKNASRYIYNSKLSVSVEIPRAVHRKYYNLKQQE